MNNSGKRDALLFLILFGGMGLILLGIYLKIDLHNPLTHLTLISIVGVGIYLFIVYRPEPIKSTSHGSAGWATEADLTEFSVDAATRPAPGALMLGPSPYTSEQRIDIPKDLMLRHTLILGPTGIGKGRGFFLWALANFDGSFIYADPKSEGWNLTSGMRKAALRYAPREPDNSEGFNWIPLCGSDAHVCFMLADAVVSGQYAGKERNAFFQSTETYFIAAVFAHANTFAEPTPAAVYDFITSFRGDLLTHVLLNSPNQIARNYAVIFSRAEEKLRGNIMMGAGTTLNWLADEKVRRFTSSTKVPPDFGRLRREKIGVYWCLSESDITVLPGLSTLFFTLAMHQIKAEEVKTVCHSEKKISYRLDSLAAWPAAQESTAEVIKNTLSYLTSLPTLQNYILSHCFTEISQTVEEGVPVCFLLDEFAQLGKIPNLEKEIAILRGRGIGLVLGCQSIAQIENVQGKAAAKVVLDNLNTKVCLAGLDHDSAEYLSKSLGDRTIVEQQQSETKRGGFLGFGGDYSTTKSLGRNARRLLTADEVRRIGKREQIVISDNKRPILTQRYWFTDKGKTAKSQVLGEARTVDFREMEAKLIAALEAMEALKKSKNKDKD